MTPAMIAAQEQRLARLAELSRIPRRLQTGAEMIAVDTLVRHIRRDAATGNEFRRNR
jgi:hypothetical protein